VGLTTKHTKHTKDRRTTGWQTPQLTVTPALATRCGRGPPARRPLGFLFACFESFVVG